MEETLKIGGPLESVATDKKVADAIFIKDSAMSNKTQRQINSDLSAAIEAILLLIPSAASSLNKLADKAYVDSSVATNSATFRGTFNLVNDLHLTVSATHAQIGTALANAILSEDNNDFAYVQIPTSDAEPTEIAQTDRYKYNGTTWEYEYTLNNSGFTSDQWAAINSGITEALVTKLSALPTNTELTTALGVLTSSITTINQKIPSAASQANQLVDIAAMESYIVQVLNVLTASFNVTSSDGHVTVQISQVDGKITSVSLTTLDIASAASLSLVEGRVTTAEGNISTNSADIAILQDAYAALTQSALVIVKPTDTWPVANPEEQIIYRVVDRVNTPPQYYSDYMWNGTAMVLMATYDNAIDDVPTSGSNNLVKSGGVFNELALGAIYDVSAKNPTAGPNNDGKWESLSALLSDANLNTLIPTSVRKGGMSIKFVQSSDNKYVQYFLTKDEWSVSEADWEKMNLEEEVNQLGQNDSQILSLIEPISLTIGVSSGVTIQSGKNKIYPVVKAGETLLYKITSSTVSSVTALYIVYKDGTNTARYGVAPSEDFNEFTVGKDVDYVTVYLNSPSSDGEFTLTCGNKEDLKTKTDIINNLTSNISNKPLSAAMGKKLQDEKAAKSEIPNVPIEEMFSKISAGQVTQNSLINNDGSIASGIANYNVYPYDISNVKENGIVIIDFKTTNRPSNNYLMLAALYKNNVFVKSVIPNQDSYKTCVISFKADPDSYDTLLLERNTIGDNHSKVYSGFQLPFDDINIDKTRLDETLFKEGYMIDSNGDFVANSATINFNLYSYDVSGINGLFLIDANVGYTAQSSDIVAAGYKDGVYVDTILENNNNDPLFNGYFSVIEGEYDTIVIMRNKLRDNYTKLYYCNKYRTNDEEPKKNLSEHLIVPSKVYTLPFNASSKINIINRLYVEGILSKEIPFAKVNEMPNIICDSSINNNGSRSFVLPVELSAMGYKKKSFNVTVQSTDVSNAKNKPIRIMCIGDSLTAQGYSSLVETMFKQFGVENNNQINCLMVGTVLENRVTTIGDVTFTNRACHEGRSAWSIASYLRHICVVYPNLSQDSPTYLHEKTAWDSLGLGTKTRNGVPERTYTAYTGSEDDANLIRTTCHGYYDADPSAELWNWIVNLRGLTTFTYQGVTYTFGSSYSSSDDAAQIAAIKYLCENWNYNPFYDYQTVQVSDGEYAFNFSAYIDKYKTLANDGTTRLVVGSTAGSLVENVNSYDVCLPTHVVVIMSENDINAIPNTGYRTANDIYKCAKLIHDYNSSIKNAIGSSRHYGAFNPEFYNNIGLIRKVDGIKFSSAVYKRLIELQDNEDGITVLPIYSVQSVIGDTISDDDRVIDTLEQNELLRVRPDYIHSSNIIGYLDRAYLVTSWVISTL